MINFNSAQEAIAGYSDETLENSMQQPDGVSPFPRFLSAIELTKRGRQRRSASQAMAASQVRGGTVVSDLIESSRAIGQPGVGQALEPLAQAQPQ